MALFNTALTQACYCPSLINFQGKGKLVIIVTLFLSIFSPFLHPANAIYIFYQ